MWRPACVSWVLVCGACERGSPAASSAAAATAFVSAPFAIYRYDDLDGDHRYESAGERRELVSRDRMPPGADLAGSHGGLLALSSTRVLFAVDARQNETVAGVNAIYALDDLDGDGLAVSAGEVRPWFSGYDAQGIETPPLRGLTLGLDGAVYALRATGYTSGLPADVIRFADVNGDGDADDAGEATSIASVSDSVDDIAVDSQGAVWYVDPAAGSLNRMSGGAPQAVVGASDLALQSLQFDTDTVIAMRDDAPIFSVVNGHNPLGGTLATIRDGAVVVVWTGVGFDLQTMSRDVELLPDRSVLSLRVDSDGYVGALHRLDDANDDGDYLDAGEAARVVDPRVLEASGSPQPSHTYALAGLLD